MHLSTGQSTRYYLLTKHPSFRCLKLTATLACSGVLVIHLTNSLTRPLFDASQILADLGPVLAGERDLHHTAMAALEIILLAAHAKSGALFRFQERPAMLASVAALRVPLFPETAVFPLLLEPI